MMFIKGHPLLSLSSLDYIGLHLIQLSKKIRGAPFIIGIKMHSSCFGQWIWDDRLEIMSYQKDITIVPRQHREHR